MVAGLMIKNPSVLQGLKLSKILLFKHLQKKKRHMYTDYGFDLCKATYSMKTHFVIFL